jgi:hypothetical protein
MLTILRLRDDAGIGLRRMCFEEIEMRGLVPLLTNYDVHFSKDMSSAEIGEILSGRHEWMTGGGVQVSDILQVNGESGPRYYYRDTNGFQQLEFETEIIHIDIQDGGLLILVVPPEGKPYPTSIHGSMDAIQNVVGGTADLALFEENAVLVINKEAQTPANRVVNGKSIAGTFFVCGVDENDNPCSLTEEQLVNYLLKFNMS